MKKNSVSWLFKMAWRDTRMGRQKLFVYTSAIIIGVAAQVAISSFRDSLTFSVDNQAKELLGADISVEKNEPFQPELQAFLDSLSSEKSTAVKFASMALFPRTSFTRLSQITALEGDFPYYGTLKTYPESAASEFQTGLYALVDDPIMQQFSIDVGDTVKIGALSYIILGSLLEVPGEPVAASILGPRIFIPKNTLEQTGLIQRGSRLEYVSYLKIDSPEKIRDAVDELRERRSSLSYSFDTVEERKRDIGRAIENLSKFLNLLGFIALLLGGLGVGSSIYAYVRQKVNTIAVLRCLGASSNQALLIFLIQAVAMGMIGALIGSLIGVGIQWYLPILFNEFLPVSIDLLISGSAILTGFITGLTISVLFALFPLLAVRNVSPLYTLRAVSIPLNQLIGKTSKFLLYFAIIFSVFLYAFFILERWFTALYFTVALILCIGILALISMGIVRGSRKLFPDRFSYLWRQGFANLYRPGNQTTILILTFGLGITLISALYLTQDVLLQQIDFDSQQNNANLVLYDIQPDQNEGVTQILHANGITILQNVPIVTMRLAGLRGQTVSELLADSNRSVSRWTLTREYRVTYRDSLTNTEKILEGEFSGTYTMPENFSDAVVPVSVSEDIVDNLKLAIGDTLSWDVQGIPIKTYVSSIRSVEWEQPQPNFFVVFPRGVLESAPQFFATVVRASGRENSISAQRGIVQSYPNVSALDVSLIIETIRGFLSKISFVVQFMGLFSIVTGLFVLAGAVATSRFQRIRESVLLRTLGAVKKQIFGIQSIEYFLLSIMAAFAGLSLSLGITWLLSLFYFDLAFIPNFYLLGMQLLGFVALVLAVGLINVGETINKSPLEVLRADVS